MNPELPAYLSTRTYMTSTPPRFTVSELTTDEAIFRTISNRFEELVPGKKVKFLNQELEQVTTGFITRVDSDSVKCSFFVRLLPDEFAAIRFCEVLRSWTIPVPQTILLEPSIFVEPYTQTAILDARAKVPLNHQEGLISWSLFHASSPDAEAVEVIKGCDYGTPGVCTWSHPGRWSTGTYNLVVQRRDSSQGNIVSEDTKSWVLYQPTDKLSCGQYSDPISALQL